MKKKSEIEKVCLCGRIITNPENKTGICLNCQKKTNSILAGVGTIGIGVGIKKYGPAFVKSAIKLAKDLKK